MARFIPRPRPFASLSAHDRKQLLKCYHALLTSANGALTHALQEICRVRDFARLNGMEDHAEQLFEIWYRSCFQGYLLTVHIDDLAIAAADCAIASPPSHPGLKRKGAPL